MGQAEHGAGHQHGGAVRIRGMRTPDAAGTGPGAAMGIEPAELAAAIRRAGATDVSASALHRAAYSSDASAYRVVPAVVVAPRHADEVAAALSACRVLGVPVTCRGAGTSIAGNAVGTGAVLDFSRHMNRVLAVDAQARTAVVQPGVVQARLHRAVGPHGLRFGPDPSSHTRCTIGGMIGNNACGSRALRYGRTSDNIAELEVLTAAGTQLRLAGPAAAPASPPGATGPGAPGPPATTGTGTTGPPGATEPPELAAARAAVRSGLAAIRTELGQFGRQVSGYALEHLLPERGFDVRRALVGSEGTLAIVTGATVRLAAEPGHRVLAVLGYPDMAAAADAVPAILAHGPAACEGLDARIVDAVRRDRRAGAAVPALPRGSGWIFAEVTGPTASAATDSARRLIGDGGALEGMVVTDPAHAAALWRIREDGAGLAGRTPAGLPAYPGWEDSAVPPAVLGRYLRDLEELLRQYSLTSVPYGHFGDGCLHLRLDFPLAAPDGPALLRRFMADAARLVASYGGSLSGEHGDGRHRSELLPVLYSPPVIELFGRVKAAFDPAGLLNPGVLVVPRPLAADLRPAGLRPVRESLALRYPHDGGDFSAAVHRCTGVGKCRADPIPGGRVMCPSYLATGQEEHSTRGRARVLQEMVNGSLITGGWRSDEVREALDLCLSCKACAAECPAGVDMAAYKAEVLHQAHRHRLRPRSHYALGQLPRWAALAALAPGPVNALLSAAPAARAARFAAGIDQRRGLPRFAPATLRSWYRRHQPARPSGERSARPGRPPAPRPGRPAVLIPDTFTSYFAPQTGVAATRLLEEAGYRVSLPGRRVCCAITWISTGQLDAARRILRRTVAALLPAAQAGIPLVGLEPSCTAALKSDAVNLLGTAAARTVAGAVSTLAEALAAAPGWQPPRLDGVPVLAQPHCHHSAMLGWDADESLLRAAGAQLIRLGGCCGLAGNFGVERGHYEVSVAVAQTALLPAVRAAPPGTVLLADGFSCRTQLADLAGLRARHLAELLRGTRA